MTTHLRSIRFDIFGISALLALLLLPQRAGAASVAPPRDLGALARASAAVVYAEALESRGEAGGTATALPVTVTRFLLLDQPAGEAVGASFEVVEPGGVAEGRGAVAAGAPRYREGGRYLLFLAAAPGGRWRSRMLAHGLLEEVAGPDGEALLRPLPEAAELSLVTPDGALTPWPPLPRAGEGGRGAGVSGQAGSAFPGGAEPVGVYRRDALLAHLREVARGAAWARGRVAASLEQEISAAPRPGPGRRGPAGGVCLRAPLR